MSSDSAHARTHRYATWHARHTWHEDSTSVQGQFEDGTRVDIATWHDEDHRALRAQARNAWLHGRVLVVTDPADDTPQVIVVPVDRLTEDAVQIAVSAWSYGHVTQIAA
jgi:hypothetical protein